MGRILAIDYGQKRVGIAVTDPMQIIANGLTTVASAQIFDFLKSYFVTETVDCILVGLPRQKDGSHSESAKFINPFVQKLAKEFPDIPIERVDERYTSKMAFQTMIDAGLNKKQRQNKELIDTISATIILQTYMESRQYMINKNNE